MVVEIKLPDFTSGIKTHIERHKSAYLIGAGVAIAGVTWYFTGKAYTKAGPTNVASLIFGKNTVNQTAITMVERQGPPSHIVKCVETGETLLSQRSMAGLKGLNESHLSDHLNGGRPHVGGLHFERIGMAVV